MLGSRVFAACGIAIMSVAACVSCGRHKGEAAADYPENFNALPDTAKVAFVMTNATPDSVARFICRASLGQLSAAHIESPGIATNYAYERYSGEDMERFSSEYDAFVASLPLPDKMKMYALAGVEDPQGLGLQLGLEYMQAIRDRNMTAEAVDKEIEAFRIACDKDSDLYERFLTGFRTVLKVDEGRDIPKEIYEKYTERL